MAKEKHIPSTSHGQGKCRNSTVSVNNTTNEDRNPYLSKKKKEKEIRELNGSQNTPICMYFFLPSGY